MARSKSVSGNKADRKEQPIANPAALPDVSAVAAETVSQLSPTQGKAEGRSFERKKSEPRTNVVPINLEDEIRRRAYELYEKRGYTTGHETEDWLVAEREVLQRYHQQSA